MPTSSNPTVPPSAGSAWAHEGLRTTAATLGALTLAAAVLGGLAAQSMRGALFVLVGMAGLAALAAVVVLVRGRITDLGYLALLALASVPIDKYFAYREHVGGWPGVRFAAADLALLMLVPLALLGAGLGRVRNRIPPLVLVLYLLLLAQYAISALGAQERMLAGFEIASTLHALTLATVAAALFRRRYARPFVAIVALILTGHTVFAIVQAITGRPIGLGLGGSPEAVLVESLATGAQRLRPSGLFDHPIVYADFLLLGLPVLFAGFLAVRSRWARAGLGAALLLGLAGLALTLSRGAWISSVFAALVFVFLAWRQRMLAGHDVRRLLKAAVMVGLVGLTVFAPRIYERLTSSVSGNLEVRFELNEIALRMIAAHPLTGVGLNNFLPAMEDYDPKDVMEYFPATVHNLYLLEAAEAGLPAVALFVALWAAILGLAMRRLRAVRDPLLRWLAIALIAGFCGFLLSQIADFSHRLEPLRTILWLHVGLLFGILASGRRAPSPPLSAPGPGHPSLGDSHP